MLILINGRSSSGKTFFANYLREFFDFTHFNGDFVRELTNNRDFTMNGRICQAKTMKLLAEKCGSRIVVCDFICPTKELRKILAPDAIVQCKHLGSGRYSDTDSIFEDVERLEAPHVFVLERGQEEAVAKKILALAAVFLRRQ